MNEENLEILVAGDGNCAYNPISMLLFGTPSYANELRSLVTSYQHSIRVQVAESLGLNEVQTAHYILEQALGYLLMEHRLLCLPRFFRSYLECEAKKMSCCERKFHKDFQKKMLKT